MICRLLLENTTDKYFFDDSCYSTKANGRKLTNGNQGEYFSPKSNRPVGRMGTWEIPTQLILSCWPLTYFYLFTPSFPPATFTFFVNYKLRLVLPQILVTLRPCRGTNFHNSPILNEYLPYTVTFKGKQTHLCHPRPLRIAKVLQNEQSNEKK